MLVCTLGDLLLDVIVRLDTRLASGDDTVAATTLAPGGQAANVAAWAAALGARARIVAVQSEDDAGAILRRELSGRGRTQAPPDAVSALDARRPRGLRRGALLPGDARERGRAPLARAAGVESAQAERALDGEQIDVRVAEEERLAE